jgi:hypothetical protein
VPTVLPDEVVLRRAVDGAARAPSVHDSQPWRWRVGPDGADLFAHPPAGAAEDDRDVLLSCGAVLHHLLVALAGLGSSARVDRLPDPDRPDHLARVRPVDAPPSTGAARLAGAIGERRTDRRRFSSRPPDAAVLDVLVRTAGSWGAHLHVVGPGDARRRLVELMGRAVPLRRQQADYAAALARHTGGPAGVGPRDPHSVEHVDASVLAVLSGLDDDRLHVLRAGEAMSAVLLAATDLGLATTPMSRPLAAPRTRASIASQVLHLRSSPQAVLRVGLPHPLSPALPPTPRRSG